jgi:4-hydroxy-tetrahydrodipicolinate reductase
MRIGVVGAAGKVGSQLVANILSSPGLVLAAALVAPRSRHVGRPVSGGSIEYRPADAEMNARCDVMIDFSTPSSTMSLQVQCAKKRIPFVIGTTGFSTAQMRKLGAHARHRPMVLSENFAPGAQLASLSAAMIAQALPAALATQTHSFRLRPEPKTTISHATSLTERRISDVTEFHFDVGGVELTLTHRVNTLTAYADGALAAAHWLVNTNPAPSLYSLADIVRQPANMRNKRP